MRFAAGVDARGSGIEDHWLFGRSDDGSIALLYASRFSGKTSGVMSARAGVNGRKDWTCERILDIFPRLKERLNHGGQQLSGGEQQMLSIGRALMTNPELPILDEATEGLAPLIVREIWRVIRQIGETGISTLIMDRNYRAVLGHTDEAVVMEKGRIVLAGESAALSQSEGALKQYLGV
jgi:branched-chain amino acid transport system ATP-binding protein